MKRNGFCPHCGEELTERPPAAPIVYPQPYVQPWYPYWQRPTVTREVIC